MASYNPYKPPDSLVAERALPFEMKRGPWLLAFLIFMSIVACVSLISFAANWKEISAANPRWFALSLATISGLRFISVVGLWLWSRAAVVLYIGLSVIAISITLVAGEKLGLLGLVGVAILLLLIRKHWAYMPWLLANNSFKAMSLRDPP